jgi:uncharacterized protein DUF6252
MLPSPAFVKRSQELISYAHSAYDADSVGGFEFMRYLIRLALVASLAASIGCLPVAPTSTGSSSGSSGSGTATQGTMTAVIGPFQWTANGRVTATHSPAQGGVGTSILTISGQDLPLTEMLTFSISSVAPGSALTVGTYQVGVASTTANLMDANGTTYQASGVIGSGTITLDTLSVSARTASGTFNLVLVQNGTVITKAVSAGTYNVTF